ncbi:MAG TPA: short-chain dehydrogenase [bacterium]|jgi:hypothetical protein
MVIHSLKQTEAEDACREMRAEFPGVQIVPAWGDIFVREEYKDMPRKEIMTRADLRREFIEDVFEKPVADRLGRFFLYKLIMEHKPDVIVDCVNSATGFAYQDIYSAYYDLKGVLNLKDQGLPPNDPFFETVERFCGTDYIPQLIRHIQVLADATMHAGVHTYVKVGTTGTGGMGFNIPYTHSEEKPSGQLLAKSSMGGAHSLLLFLMGRTPGCPYVKEIKPAAAIAWKKIAYGEIKRGGKPIPLFDCPTESAETLNGEFVRNKPDSGKALGENLKSVYIDTGENGIFSTDEFFTITAAEQMEFVTPEEISQAVLWEIEGGNSGMDVIGALDSVVMGPSYRAGILRGAALNEMRRLEKETNTSSVAFEMLGPPHLSKLLYEAYLLKLAYADPSTIPSEKPETVSQKMLQVIEQDKKLRATIISIGVPILLPDGKRILRGPEVKIPAYSGSNEISIENPALVDEWADKGWVDLRPSNVKRWQSRITAFFTTAGAGAPVDTSSAFPWERMVLGSGEDNFAGKIVTHIFIEEEKGRRIKS